MVTVGRCDLITAYKNMTPMCTNAYKEKLATNILLLNYYFSLAMKLDNIKNLIAENKIH